jgi:hypothetical protein
MSAVDVAAPREPCWEIADRIKALLQSQTKGMRRLEILGIQSEIDELNKRLAVDFGRRYGWQSSDRPFTIRTLARGGVHDSEELAGSYDPEFCDHPHWYRSRRHARAIAAHLYVTGSDQESAVKARQGEILIWAAARGLQASFPDYPSWWYPGWTMLVLYQAAER